MFQKTHRMPSPVVRLVLVLIAFVAWGSATAQLSGKGEVRGTVTDPQGAVVPGAKVVATKVATGVATETVTTSAGDYSLPALDPGEYSILISAPGFQKLEQEHVQVNALESMAVNPHLTVGGDTQTVTVSTEPPALETNNATLGATIEHEMYEALPIEMGAYGQADQRRATDFAFLMPGVQGNNTTGNATTNAGIVNGSGSRGGVTGIYIDGVVFVRAGGNGDPRYIWTAVSVDAVDQFQLQTSGYSAIYEGQGIQNYTIKTGGNQYHGQIYEFFRNTVLDTWGYFGANTTSPYTGLPTKPVEHSNEYGINLSGPLVPFGKWKDKLFGFVNYNGFRYSSQTPTQITFPNLAQQGGNFTGVANIYDPSTAASCTAHNGGFNCRYQYGYTPGTGTAQNVANPGNGVLTGTLNQIPSTQFSTVALGLQSLIPTLSSQAVQLNYNAANSTALNNWSTTERIDWTVTPKDTLTFVAAIGRQASSSPVGQATVGRNVGPVPYNYGQAYAPKTAVGLVEYTHSFTSHLINQLKYGFARYNGPTFNSDAAPGLGASSLGKINGLPTGQASNSFPIVTFTGTNPATNWGGTTANVVIAQNFTLVDNVQWQKGAHSITAGAQIAWMQYLNQPATGGSTPLTLAAGNAGTGQYVQAAGVNSSAIATNTGSPYASLLIGQVNSSTMTNYVVQEFSSRFRAISPYVQDAWRVNSRLTLDLGLRWDYFPPVQENVDNLSFFSPTVNNPITGLQGGLQFAGNGTNTCNCRTPINNYWKNISPRVGFAFQSDDKTVWRGSFGVMFTHGNAVGGGTASQTGAANLALGFSATTTSGLNADQTSQLSFPTTSTTYTPAVQQALGRASGPQYGTGNTKTAGYTSSSPASMAYLDPYTGSRAPEFINWSFGFQHSWTSSFTSNISYVGSQGHFLYPDSLNARGYYANQLDPKYLRLAGALSTAAPAACAANPGVCPANVLAVFNTSQPLSTLLKPFPFQGVSDATGNVGNANYHALQTTFNMRAGKNLTFMANYTWSRSIDDAGTYRTGYAIPQAVSNTDKSWAADRIERGVSTSNQPHHFVLTGVYSLPFGRSILAHNAAERAIFGGFKVSTIFQAFSGSPVAITGASCPANPAASTCMPNYNPAYPLSKNVRIHGNYGQGVTRATAGTTPFIDINAFQYAPAYTFGNLARTAPYDLYGPGNYQWDLSLRRSFALHFTQAAKFNFQADLYNVTNKTFFALASTSYFPTNTAFGGLVANTNYNRRAAQLSARLEF